MRSSEPFPEQAESSLLERQLVERLSAAFRDAEWEVSGDRKADLVVAHGPKRYVVEVKVARQPRKAEGQGSLADAIPRSKSDARPTGGKPLALVRAAHTSAAL